MSGEVLALGYAAVYLLGGLAWHVEGAPGHIAMLPVSPFVFPWYAVYAVAFGVEDRRSTRGRRNRRAERYRRRYMRRQNARLNLRLAQQNGEEGTEDRGEQLRRYRRQRQILAEGSSSPGLLERVKRRILPSTGGEAELDLDTTFAETTDSEQSLDLDTSFADYTDPLDLDTSFANNNRDDRFDR